MSTKLEYNEMLRKVDQTKCVCLFSSPEVRLSGRVLASGPVVPGSILRLGTDDVVGKHRNSSRV